jgi:hypothetical protein
VKGLFRGCIGTDGQMRGVFPIQSTGIPSYDGAIVAAMQGWQYEPVHDGDQVVSVCTIVAFIYTQR